MSILPSLLTPEEEGLSVKDFGEITKRNSFSSWLPYLAYLKEDKVYLNSDDTIGKIWECSPIPFLSDNSAEYLSGILSQEYPKDTVISFMLYSDDHIDPILNKYIRTKYRKDPISIESASHYTKYISDSRKGMDHIYGIPTRNFRLIVSIKSHEKITDEQFSHIEEGLSGAGLSPRHMEPEVLLDILRRIFNESVTESSYQYDINRYLRSQIILSDTVIHNRGETMWIGDRPMGCLTPKMIAPNVNSLGVNSLIGGYKGMEDDNTQLTQKFFWTTTVVFKTNENSIKNKSSIMMSQRAGGTLSKYLSRRVEELGWVLDEINAKPYCDVIISLWIVGKNEDDLNKGLARAKGLWERGQCKFTLQRENKIMQAMLIAALPFGLYLGKKLSNLEKLNRDFPMSCDAAARILPVQADFCGNMNPAMILIGRKGQVITIDVFEEGSINHNLFICAGSGAGKSFFTNFLASNYYSIGALIRIIDIGYSYEKQCLIRKGRFIDVGDERNRLVLNPFRMKSAGHDSEDKSSNHAMVTQIILAMIYSATGTSKVTETEITLCKQAVDFAYNRDEGKFGIDHVSEFLKEYPKNAPEGSDFGFAKRRAHEMSFNLKDWTSKGQYGHMFNGESTIDISSDDFVVLELEKIMGNQELFHVISLQVMNAITNDLYLSDRSQRRFMLFDEAWKYLISNDKDSSGDATTSTIASIIQEGYRRARKYGGSTGIVTQSPLDLGRMGKAGEVIKGNSAYKFLLQNNREEWLLASKRDILSYSGLALELASTIKNHRPHYSEIFLETPFGNGVGRLTVDPWSYWINTSDAREFSRFKKKMKELNYDTKAAITELIIEDSNAD